MMFLLIETPHHTTPQIAAEAAAARRATCSALLGASTGLVKRRSTGWTMLQKPTVAVQWHATRSASAASPLSTAAAAVKRATDTACG